MRRRTLLLTLATTARTAAAEKLQVVASFSILADMARQVGGELVRVRSLVPVDGDAHTYEPRPSDLQAVRAAGVVLTNGLGLEGWLDRLLKAAGGPARIVVASAGVTPRHWDEGVDPHAWQDPRNGMLYAHTIGEAFAQADPANATTYRARAEEFARHLAAIDAWTLQQFVGVPAERRRILTSHDAFGYFGARYDIEFVGVQGIDTESEPSAAAIAALVKQIKATGIKAVFVENMTSPKLASMVARESGAVLGPTVYSDALSPPGGPADTYEKMFRHNVPLFVKAMQANG
jgi:zinc/manganese transport system substrate-binding protein